VEDGYERDLDVQKLWRKSVRRHRSQQGDKIPIEFTGPMDLLEKFDTLTKAIKKTHQRFRKMLGCDAKISLIVASLTEVNSPVS